MNHATHSFHPIATVGARTLRGGEVISGCEQALLYDRPVARVGDYVAYPDGSRATIITGSRLCFLDGHAIAAVGSMLDNGDAVTESPQSETYLSDSDGYGPALDHVAGFA